MRRPESRQKEAIPFEAATHVMWQTVWQLFCPWVSGQDVSPVKKKRSSPKIGIIMLAVMGMGLMTGIPAASAASVSEGKIILAALDTTVPRDKHLDRTVDLFGAHETQFQDIRPFTKWTGVLNRFKRQFATSLQQQDTKKWIQFLNSHKESSDNEKIEAVNDYMNQKRFVPDTENYASRDHWATPMEFLSRGGDCEDYAIAKYLSLRSLGFPQDKMRLAVVYDRVMRMPHAILVVYHDGEALVLDNQNPAIMDSVDITRYKPIYSISQVAWWRH